MINVPEQIKQICMKDNARKNFRVRFTDGSHSDLVNENFVADSVELQESVCASEIKFGNCEASSITFICDLDGNYRGKEIACQLEIDISSESDEFIAEYGHTSDDVPYPFYPINYGTYTITSCKINKDGLRIVEAYTQALGENKVGVEGNISFSEYGLSNFEIAKMNYPSNNVPYEFDFLKFLVSNLQNYDPNQFDMDESIPMVAPESEGVVIKSTSNKQYYFDFLINIEGVNTAVSDTNLYYYDFSNFEKFHPITLEEFREEVMSTADPLISGETFTESALAELNRKIDELYHKYFNRKAGGIKNELARNDGKYSKQVVEGIDPDDESTYDSFYALKGYLYPYISTGVQGSIRFGACTGIQIQVSRASGGGVYFNNIDATMHPIVRKCNVGISTKLSYPRSKSIKIGSAQQYSLDYVGLFNDGISITKKDKKGNTITYNYKFSFRDMVEAYAEINASFGNFWRKSGAYSFDTLEYPDSIRPNFGLHPSDSVFPSGAKALITKNLIMDMECDDTITKPYGKVICTCTPLGATEEEDIVYEIIDTSSMADTDYLVYDVSDNYFFATNSTSIEGSQIYNLLANIGRALEGFRYMPVYLEMQGLPYIETGDLIEFESAQGTMFTIAMKNTIKGIQHLRTIIESEE